MKQEKEEKKIGQERVYLKNILTLGVSSFILALGISSVFASYEPSTSPGSAYELITPNFNALLIGRGTDPTSNGDLKVMGNATVIGDVITDTLDSYSGGDIDISTGINIDAIDTYSESEITISAPIVATNFGDIYYKKSSGANSCTSATGCPTGSTAGFYFTSASCADDELMLGCTGYITSSSSSANFIGSWMTHSSTATVSQYFCKAEANVSGVVSMAVCLSPTESQGTNTSAI